ncbi:MAG: chemotaxis protein CheX [Pseudomonadales bacterium]|nr:chemotaxis protein CheX [Pseudomonadales bacterium]
MDRDFVNSFLDSTSNVLATMAAMDFSVGHPRFKKEELPISNITGMIAMSSPQAVGTLVISFTEPVILSLASRMLMETVDEINGEVIDLVGELTNMVTGGAKRVLEEKGFDFDMATPVVIQGENQQITQFSNGPTIVVPYSTDAGDFYVEICFEAIDS